MVLDHGINPADVVITESLRERPRRQPDLSAEIHALTSLASAIATTPDTLPQRLVDTALELCGAGSAGLSLLESGDQGEIFRWVAMGGAYAGFVGGTTPRDFSPCGTTLERGSPQLFSLPARCFTYFEGVEPPIVEGLVVPVYGAGRPLGTIWVVAHDENRKFDLEDVRLLESVASFAGALHVVTARNQADAVVRQRDKFLDLVLDTSGDCIKVLELDSTVVSMSASGQRLLEIEDVTTVLDKPWLDFWQGEDRVRAEAALQDAMTNGKGRFFGYCPTATGTPRWWDVQITPILDTIGEPERLLCISRDITDERKQQEALDEKHEQARRAHERFRLLFERSRDGILIADDNGRYVEVNEAAAEILGHPVERLTSMSVADIVTSDGPPTAERYAAYLEKGHESGEFEFVRPDGEHRVIDYAATRIGPGLHLSIIRDVTARKQMEEVLRQGEERLNLALQSARMVPWEWDVDRDVILIGDTFREIYGIERVQAAEKGYALVHPEDRERYRSTVQGAAQSGDGYDTEFRIIRPDNGEVVWIEERCRAVSDNNGGDRRLIGIATDVTSRTAREHEIQALNTRLQQAIRETHHRVKNNLQVLAAMVDMQLMDERQVVPVAEMERLALHIRALAAIHDVLTTDTRTNYEDGVRVREILQHLLPLLQSTVGESHLVYTIDDAVLSVGRVSSLCLIINELVSNAVKHGHGEVELTFQVADEVGTLEVCDDGPGFPSDFDPVKSSNTGLDLVRNLAAWDLRGTVTFENRNQGGAKVIVVIPITPFNLDARTASPKTASSKSGLEP